MRKLHETHKKLITMYVTTLLDAAPGGYKDKEKTIEAWLNAFSYIQTTKEYLDFEKACQQLLNNNETLPQMPLPGKIRQMIRDNNREYEGLGERPSIRPKFSELRKEMVRIGKLKDTCKNAEQRLLYKRQYYKVVVDMCNMCGESVHPGFTTDMLSESWIDRRLRTKQPIHEGKITIRR